MPPIPPRPTEAELGILSVLWQLGPCTVKQAHQAIAKDREFTYTGALKLMQIMRDKGLLLRDESNRSHVYWPAHSQEEMQGSLLGDFMDRAFAGSGRDLVLAALRAGRVSPEEKADIRRLLGEEEA
ncbi:MAG: BlaI/MecI/CopY family transcriptional regulator [Holophagaceae bacterium]|nr:BlaI/MecI/CopY family transcriptional regulator [Holophagaceae bacterium]